MIFSNNGDSINKIVDSYVSNRGVSTKVGSTLFNRNGIAMHDMGNVAIGNRGSVQVVGNTIHTNKGVYNLVGNVLTGPDGKTWYGVDSINVAKDIASMDIS